MKKHLKLLLLTLFVAVGANAQNINVSGNISTNTTWSSTSIDTVKVLGNLTIDTLTTLTIEPGIVIDFTDHYYLNVKGNLHAEGTAVDSIRFTTSDTSGYATGTHHGWSGIRIHRRNYSGDTTVLSYCVIEYGKADGTSSLPNSTHGGGLYTYSSWKVKLNHSALRCNQSTGDGGGWWDYYTFVNNGPSQDIVDCRFTHNIAYGSSGGGGIFTTRSYNLNLLGCEFTHNTVAISGIGGALRNGPYAGHYSVVDMDECRFAYNTAPTGGAVGLTGGPALMTVKRSIFHNNSAFNGGGLYLFQVPINLQNNLIVNNEASNFGGGFYSFNVVSESSQYPSTMAHNTVAHNRAKEGGGIYVYDGLGGSSVSQPPNLYIYRSIIYGNESTTPGINDDIGMGTASNNNHTRFYNCSFGSDLNNTGVSIFTLVDIANLNFTDPLFVSPSGGAGQAFDGFSTTDWSLDYCNSPCIDHVGYVNPVFDSIDYAGSPRVLNGVSDIGAFEHPGFTSQPQDLSICEGDSAIFTSSFYAPQGVSNSFWTFSIDGGSSWISAPYVDTYVLLTSAQASNDGILIFAQHDFGCGQMNSDTALLTVYPSTLTPVSLTICSNDSAFLQGSWQQSAGTFLDTLASVNGCDSVIETTLSVNPSYLFTTQQSICQGDSLLLYGNYQSTAGNYYDSLQTALGCDSVYLTTLIVNPSPVITTNPIICSNDSFFAQGSWQHFSGTYYDTLQTTANCDSVIVTNLTVNFISSSLVDTGFCAGSSYTLNGSTYTQGGVYQQVLTNSLGCDSLLTLFLVEYAAPDAEIGPDTLWVCDGDTLHFGIDTSGVANYSISNFFTTANNDSLSFVYDVFGGFSNVVSQVTGTNGCTSNDVVVLESNEIVNMAMNFPTLNDPSVTFSIAAMPSNVDFWYWSFGDGDTLSGDPNPTHLYTSNGNYTACLIAINECGRDSSCHGPFSIVASGLAEQQAIDLTVYPNPGTGTFHLNTQYSGIIQASVYNALGEMVSTFNLASGERVINLQDLSRGSYAIKLQLDQKTVIRNIILLSH